MKRLLLISIGIVGAYAVGHARESKDETVVVGERLGAKVNKPARSRRLTEAENREAGDLFAKAYMECRRGEALVSAKDGNNAASAYLEAERILLSLRNAYPSWHPEMVEHRRRKIAEVMIGPVAQLLPEFVQAAALCQRAVRDYREGQWDAAIEKLGNVLSLDIKNARAHFYLSLAAEVRGWTDLAAREMNIAKDLDPGIERELDSIPALVR